MATQCFERFCEAFVNIDASECCQIGSKGLSVMFLEWGMAIEDILRGKNFRLFEAKEYFPVASFD